MTKRDYLESIIGDLGGLYTATGNDWSLRLHQSLTEPTCPTASIQPDGWSLSRYRVDADSIEKSLRETVARVRSEILDRHIVGHAAPFTNPDDAEFEKWLQRRAAGSDEQMPEPPCDNELPPEFEWVLDGYLKDHRDLFKDEPDKSPYYIASYIFATVRRYLDRGRINETAAIKMIQSKLAA